MEKIRKVRGSALITEQNEVFFTPYKRQEEDEKLYKIMEATQYGQLKKSQNRYQVLISLPQNVASKGKFISEISHLLAKTHEF